MILCSLAQAANLVGVTQRQARNLVDSGDIVLVSHGVVDAASVSSYLRNRGVVTRRVWGEETAWAAIGLLGRTDVTWLGAAQASRLRRRVSGMDAEELASRVRNRSDTHRFDGHRSVVDRVGNELVRGSSLIGGLSVERGVDGYIDTARLPHLVDRFRLRASADGLITVRCTHHVDRAREIAAIDADLLAAVDLATAADAREREAALTVITSRIATV